MTKKGLGRTFDSLIPTDLLDESFDPTADQDNRTSEMRHVKLSQVIVDPEQPRKHFEDEALSELAASIKEHGLLQPLVVVTKGVQFQIVAGERRFRAMEKLGLEKVPVIVRSLSDQSRLEVSLIENIQRQDLTPIETATAYAKLRDQFNMNLDQISERLGGRSTSAISNTMRLLKLPKAARQALQERKINEGQARPMVGLDESLIEALLPRIIKEGWSAREIERQAAAAKKNQRTEQVVKNVNTYSQEAMQIGERLQTPVDVRVGARGSGTIVIRFRNQEEFKRIKNVFTD